MPAGTAKPGRLLQLLSIGSPRLVWAVNTTVADNATKMAGRFFNPSIRPSIAAWASHTTTRSKIPSARFPTGISVLVSCYCDNLRDVGRRFGGMIPVSEHRRTTQSESPIVDFSKPRKSVKDESRRADLLAMRRFPARSSVEDTTAAAV
jgi:hypothetical protein